MAFPSMSAWGYFGVLTSLPVYAWKLYINCVKYAVCTRRTKISWTTTHDCPNCQFLGHYRGSEIASFMAPVLSLSKHRKRQGCIVRCSLWRRAYLVFCRVLFYKKREKNEKISCGVQAKVLKHIQWINIALLTFFVTSHIINCRDV